MSTLALTWNEQRVFLACRPDPSQSPVRMDTIFGESFKMKNLFDGLTGYKSDIPVQHTLNELLCKNSVSSNNTRFIGTILNRLVERLNCDERVMAHMMEQCFDSIILVAPSGATQEQVQAVSRNTSSFPGVPITIISHPIAVFANSHGRFESGVPFFFLNWDDDLTASMAIAYDTMRHITRMDQQWRLQKFNPQSWHMYIERFLLTSHGIGSDRTAEGTRWFIDRKVLRVQVQAILKCIMDGASSYTMNCSALEKSSEKEKDLNVQFDKESIAKIATPIQLRLQGFLLNCLKECSPTKNTRIVFSGKFIEHPGLLSFFEDLCAQEGLNLDPGKSDAALFGALNCVKHQPMLAYDCGIVIRESGYKMGLGTLVLVRPTAVNEEKVSEPLHMALGKESVLEVCVYVRKMNPEMGTVEFGVLKSHAFAPTITEAGETTVSVSMRVNEPDGQDSTPTINVVVLDHNNGNREVIKFSNLSMVIEGDLSRPPLRESDELKGVRLTQQVVNARNAISDEQRESRLLPADWYRLFSGLNKALIPRSRYWYSIMQTVGVHPIMVMLGAGIPQHIQDVLARLGMNNDTLKTCTPDKFQQVAREVLYVEALLLGRKYGGSAFKRWFKRMNSAREAPAEHSVIKIWFNGVIENLAGTEDEDSLRSKCEHIVTMYGHACTPPSQINIQWDQWDKQESHND